jgi:spore coat protein U domain-containing protein, fimbrial subunit CupE1/2/3/6
MRTVLVTAVAVLALRAARADAGSCSLSSVVGVSFGSYNVFDAAPVSSAGSLTYVCTGVQPADRVTIELSVASEDPTLRTMSAGAHALRYQLYLDAARTIIWATGAGGTSTYGPIAPAEATPTLVPIYGLLPARQDVAAGSYHDTLTVTLLL